MAKKIPARLNDYAIYLSGGGRLTSLGTANVTLPTIEALSDTISGTGMLGEAEVPTIGHFGSMELELEWNTVDGNAVTLASGMKKDIVIRARMQTESSLGHDFESVRVYASVRPKTIDLGSLEIGSATGTTNTLECVAIKVVVADKDKLEIDKFAGIYRVDGKSMLPEGDL
jgi:uncharacterized protein